MNECGSELAVNFSIFRYSSAFATCSSYRDLYIYAWLYLFISCILSGICALFSFYMLCLVPARYFISSLFRKSIVQIRATVLTF